MATVHPPSLTLEDAVLTIKKMHKLHKGRDVAIDLMPSLLGISPKSSYLSLQIGTMSKYGFIERRPNDQLYLSDLAMQIIQPLNSTEVYKAKLKAANNIDILNDIIKRYPNFKLPSKEQLREYIYKAHSIPRDRLNAWAEYVIKSTKTLESDSPPLEEKKTVIQVDTGNKIEHNKYTVNETFQNFELPSGKRFSFSLEDEYTLDDLEFITDFFELKKKRIKK
ncbi:MAG: hypothetical protein IIC75_08405 [Bacteroidetes bacterium]|nr:hypothetical protein [Bacteroidota bacterium]